MRALRDQTAHHDVDALRRVTPRQHQILAMLSTGRWTRREVADLLVISEDTVQNTVRDAYARLGVDNLVAALRALGCIRTSE